MKTFFLTLFSPLCLMSALALAQESDEPRSAESILIETCAAAGIDLNQPASEMSRVERRAFRNCTEEAERLAARSDASEESDESDDEGLICRRESVVGTHQRRRVCTTQAERDEMRESTNEVLRNVARPRGELGPEG